MYVPNSPRSTLLCYNGKMLSSPQCSPFLETFLRMPIPVYCVLLLPYSTTVPRLRHIPGRSPRRPPPPAPRATSRGDPVARCSCRGWPAGRLTILFIVFFIFFWRRTNIPGRVYDQFLHRKQDLFQSPAFEIDFLRVYF